MSEIILSQRVNYASIDLLKNYSRLDEKEKLKKLLNKPDNYDDGHLRLPMSINQWAHLNIKKNTIFFDFSKEIINLYPPREDFRTYYTLKPQTIQRHFSNPFSSISITTIDRKVKLVGDKLIVSKYNLTRKRGTFFKYFKKTSSSNIISIDLKTGNIKTIVRLNKSKTFRTNNFQTLFECIHNIFRHYDSDHPSEKVNKMLIDTFDNKIFISKVLQHLNHPHINGDVDELKNVLIKFFVEKRKIKVPNTFDKLLTNFYPTEKFLKKNDRKLIQSILDAIGCKSKLTVKLVHIYPDFSIKSLGFLCQIFGNDYHRYLSQIDPKVFYQSSVVKYPLGESLNHLVNYFIGIRNDNRLYYNLTDRDRSDIVKMINTVNVDLSMNLNLIVDHINMFIQIKDINPNITINARNLSEFNLEHENFSKIVRKIKRGYTIELEYKPEMVTEVEKPITNDETKLTLHPYILKNEEEYIVEGEFMHHCVGSYVNKDRSIIVSLRKEDLRDRITCEFDVENGECVQARHFCNGPVPIEFDFGLSELKDKMKKFSRKGQLKQIGKKNVPLNLHNSDTIEGLLEQINQLPFGNNQLLLL